MRFAGATLIFSLGLCAAATAQDPPTVLKRCAEVRNLPRAEAKKNVPVRVRGVVTRITSTTANGFAIHDDTGIYVGVGEALTLGLIRAPLPDIKINDLVEVVGLSGPGHFAPVIWPTSLRVVGTGEQPQPIPATMTEIESGKLDCQRVTISGIVHSARAVKIGGWQHLQLTIAAASGRMFFAENDLAAFSDPTRLEDSEVVVSGVVGPFFNSRGETVGSRLYSSLASDIRVLKPAPQDPFAASELSLRSLLRFEPEGAPRHRRTSRGTVTLCVPGEYFYIESERRGIRVETDQKDPLAPGDLVQVAGFISMRDHFAMIHDAIFRRTGSSDPPQAVATTRQEIMTEPNMNRSWEDADDFDGRLVTISGRLYGVDQRPKETFTLYIDADGQLTPARLPREIRPGDLAKLQPGSLISTTGVCQVKFSHSLAATPGGPASSVEILMRDADDVRVLEPAPWWTTRRLFTALGVAGCLIALSFLWVIVLRARVARRGAQLAEEIRARRDAEVEHFTAHRERTRLAADLHDTLEQSLTGLALQLEAADALREAAPDRSVFHLGLAQQLLGRSREDVRRNVWDLRMNPLNTQTLDYALRAIAEDRSLGLPVKIQVTCDGNPRKLPDFIAGNLLLLVQESITNALKHGDPREITLHVAFTPGAVTITVTDDGCGFDVPKAPTYKEGHFGVQGMRERAIRIGGDFTITSQPGEGTCVRIVVRTDPGMAATASDAFERVEKKVS